MIERFQISYQINVHAWYVYSHRRQASMTVKRLSKWLTQSVCRHVTDFPTIDIIPEPERKAILWSEPLVNRTRQELNREKVRH